MMDEQHLLLSVNDAAARLGVHPITVRRLVDENRLPCVRVRTCVRIPMSAIENYVAEGGDAR